ncbi:hypothetical protein [Streptomyces sp. NPDC051286]|uniref:hypothetical protein n=1 Tax=Streptomyces sp. NPDC051286 TaxID=3365647 RepID=UPI003792A000
MVLVVASAVLALTGPGRWSADHAFGLAPWPLWVPVVAIVAGPVSGLLTRAVLHRPSVKEGTAQYAHTTD